MEHSVGPGGAVIHPVIGADSALLPVAVELFGEIFGEYEHYVPYVRACARQTTPDHPATFDHVWVIERDGEYIGLRVMSYVHTRNLGHDAFVGVRQPYRGQGIGGWLVQETMAQLRRDAARFGHGEPLGDCAEVEPPEEDGGLALDFHLKRGGVVLPVEYYEPPMIRGVSYITDEQLAGVASAPMLLVFYPMSLSVPLRRNDLSAIIEGMYLDVYRLERDSWQFRRAMNSIGGNDE